MLQANNDDDDDDDEDELTGEEDPDKIKGALSLLDRYCTKNDKTVAKNEGPLPKMLNSPADGTSVSLPLSCKSVVRPLVEDLFIYRANGPGRLSRPPA